MQWIYSNPGHVRIWWRNWGFSLEMEEKLRLTQELSVMTWRATQGRLRIRLLCGHKGCNCDQSAGGTKRQILTNWRKIFPAELKAAWLSQKGVRSHHGKFWSWMTSPLGTSSKVKNQSEGWTRWAFIFRWPLKVPSNRCWLYYSVFSDHSSLWQFLIPLYLMNFMSLRNSFGD